MEGEWLNFQFLTPYSPDEKYPDRLTVKLDDYKKDEPKQVASAPVALEEDVPFWRCIGVSKAPLIHPYYRNT